MKAVPMLTISSEQGLQKDMEEIVEQSKNNSANIELQLYEKEKAIALLIERDSIKADAIASLSDQLSKVIQEIEMLTEITIVLDKCYIHLIETLTELAKKKRFLVGTYNLQVGVKLV